MNNVVTPSSAATTLSWSPYPAKGTGTAPSSVGAREGSRTSNRWSTPAAARSVATRPPRPPVDPVTARVGSSVFTPRRLGGRPPRGGPRPSADAEGCWMTTDPEEMSMSLPASLAATTVAVLGGTGPQGRGLARRFATAGLPVVIGSRSADRAEETAKTLASATGGDVTGADSEGAAAAGDIVIVAVPWDGHGDLLRSLAGTLTGKVVVDCVNPLGFDKQGAFVLEVEEGSAAEQAAALLPDSTVIGAFHSVSAVKLEDPDVAEVDTDVLVLGEGENREACDLVQDLAGVIPGVRGVYGGRLRNAHQVESLTANLIAINRRYKAHAGIRITDI